MDDKKNFELCKLEKEFTIFKKENKIKVEAFGMEFPLAHPYSIYMKIYRTSLDPDTKYQAMKKVNDILWPQYKDTWHSWTEERFRAHCGGYKAISMAGPAAAAKSLDAARIACIFWLSNPRKNSCVIASVTLDSLETRIWGYVSKLMDTTAIPIPYKLYTGRPPHIKHKKARDKIHGMYATAIARGEEEKVLSTIIGRHPDYGIMLILDEATDMNPAIIQAIANLSKGVEFFQLWTIGNSKSKKDLHGSISTPKAGWDKIDPMRDSMWETAYEGGICLYSNPFKSPAITDPDLNTRKLLGKFLPTMESIKKDKKEYGETSDLYYRFVLGFWKGESMDDAVFSEKFLSEHSVTNKAEWGGYRELHIVAGLDPAIRSTGSGCVLRFGVLGVNIHGKYILDYMGSELLHHIQITPNPNMSSDLQLCHSVLAMLAKYNCPLSNLAIDATGIGRAIASLLQVLSGGNITPIKIISTKKGEGRKQSKLDAGTYSIPSTMLWTQFRAFVETSQIYGLDPISMLQFSNRQLITDDTGKVELETKGTFKTRMQVVHPSYAKSPDEADAATLVLQAAQLCYNFYPGKKMEQTISQDISNYWDDKARAMDLFNPKLTPANDKPSRPKLMPNFSNDLENSI